MLRQVWVLIHRWVGLVIAGFLLLAGLTGALLAWYHELDHVFAARLHQLPVQTRASASIDPITLREQLAARYPSAQFNYVALKAEPDRSVQFYLDGALDPVSKKPIELANDEVFVDPRSGAVLGERKWGAISQGQVNLMPFIYKLHYALALGTVGTYIFGIVALLWTIDCFVGAYLTLPSRRTSGNTSWWQRWKPAWLLRWRSGAYKLNFDLHRAGGLWVWAMLFVFAWSSVAFNLQEVYRPAMKVFFALDERERDLPTLPQPQAQPGIAWRDAHAIGQTLMAQEAQRLGLTVFEEQSLSYNPAKALYRYTVRSSADIRDRFGATRVFFDANTGALKHSSLPTGQYAGETVTHWLMTLHMADVWGLPFRIFVCLMGLVVAMLSVTGVVIWLKKRQARLHGRARAAFASTLRPV